MIPLTYVRSVCSVRNVWAYRAISFNIPFPTPPVIPPNFAACTPGALQLPQLIWTVVLVVTHHLPHTSSNNGGVGGGGGSEHILLPGS
jgi:hypothetical protein